MSFPSHGGARVAVLGAGGFIGRNAAGALAALGAGEILATARTKESLPSLPAATDVSLDVLDEQAVSAFFEQARPTHVVNCVAHGTLPGFREFGLAFRTNVTAALHAYRQAARNGAVRFVHLGTCEEYGRHDGPIPEDRAPAPEGVYALSKAAGTHLLLEESRDLDTELLVLRPFGTWGPGEAAHRLVPAIVAGAVERRRIPMSDGAQLRDFALVSDVGRAVAELAMSAAAPKHRVFNVGSGIATSVRDFALRVADVLGCRDLLDFGAIERRANEMPSMIPDAGRLREQLGWLPGNFDSAVVIAMRDQYERRGL